MTIPATATFKRGDSFVLACIHKVDGVATALTGVSIRSQLRYASGELVSELTAVIAANQVATPGAFHLQPANQTVTKLWKAPGTLFCDIEFTKNNAIYSTSTFSIPIEKDITI